MYLSLSKMDRKYSKCLESRRKRFVKKLDFQLHQKKVIVNQKRKQIIFWLECSETYKKNASNFEH